MDEVYSKQPLGSAINACTASSRLAKLELKIFVVKRAEPASILDGILTVILAEVAVWLSNIYDPIAPPEEIDLGNPLGSILTGIERLSAN